MTVSSCSDRERKSEKHVTKVIGPVSANGLYLLRMQPYFTTESLSSSSRLIPPHNRNGVHSLKAVSSIHKNSTFQSPLIPRLN